MRLNQFCQPLQWGILNHVKLEWRRSFRGEYDCMARFLTPTDELATVYPGKDVYWDEGYRIVIHKDGRIVGIDDEDFENRITLAKNDIILYRFDLKRFQAEMCESFRLRPDISDVQRGVIPWGFWEPEKGESFPVTLLLRHSNSSFREWIFDLILRRTGTGAMILTPTRSEWKGEVVELARKNKLLLVPLDEIIQMEDGKIQPTPEWDEYLAAFGKMIERDLPSRHRRQSEYVFAKRGLWVYRFDEKETILDSSFQGAFFIQHLLQHPQVEFHVEKLWFEVMSRTTEQAVSVLHVERAFASEMEIPNSLLGGADEVVDAEARREYEARLKELAQERREAEEDKDAAKLDRIDEEFDFLRKTLQKAKTGKYQSKKLGDTEVQLYDRIRKAVSATIKQIEKNDPVGATYLKNTIKTGKFMSFSPSDRIEWQFV